MRNSTSTWIFQIFHTQSRNFNTTNKTTPPSLRLQTHSIWESLQVFTQRVTLEQWIPVLSSSQGSLPSWETLSRCQRFRLSTTLMKRCSHRLCFLASIWNTTWVIYFLIFLHKLNQIRTDDSNTLPSPSAMSALLKRPGKLSRGISMMTITKT